MPASHQLGAAPGGRRDRPVALDGPRLVTPTAGHFVAAAAGFAEQLERFLSAAS